MTEPEHLAEAASIEHDQHTEPPDSSHPGGPQDRRSLSVPVAAAPKTRTFEPAPDDLGDRGQALWVAVVKAYVLGPHELSTLVEVCRTADTLDALAEVVREAGPMAAWGSGGRAHPALVEARQQRLTLAKLLRALGIPPDEADERGGGPRRSNRYRRGYRGGEAV